MSMAAKDVFSSPGMDGSPEVFEAGDDSTGFEGAISNLTLPDVIQLEGQNLFSGSILVVYQEQEGQIFFHRGEVVHAEVGRFVGEEAFNRILVWPGGSFHLHPNVTSLRQSIHKRREHLLLAAHQWLDENRQGLAELGQGGRQEPSPAARPRDVLQVIGAVPGVVHAVLMDRDGSPKGNPGAPAESLAARSTYLATMVAAPLAAAFRLGELQVAATHGGAERMVLFRSKETSLAVCLAEGAALEAVEVGIRRALSPHKAER